MASKTRQRILDRRKTIWAGTFSLFLAGCGGGGSGSPAAHAAILRGHVHGGQSPITGSTVTLYAVGAGAAAQAITTTSTDGSGNFDFGSGVTCSSSGLTPTTLIYVTASGGNPGAGQGVNNGAINLVAALGQCQNATSVDINEVTTAAAAYALAAFTTTGAGSVDIHSSASNTVGLANAFATSAVLADPVAGQAPSALGTSQLPAQQTLYSLANALAACVNTSDSGSAQCAELFACAVPGAAFDGTGSCSGGSGPVPADTLSAVLSVTHNPGLVPAAGVYDVATRNAVFSPALGAAPNDWTVGFNFSGGSINGPLGIAIDAAGDVWVTNSPTSAPPGLTELTPTGTPAAGSPFTNPYIGAPTAIAIDAGGDVWTTNSASGTNLLVKFDPSSPATTTAFANNGLYNPFDLAIDASGNLWIPNFNLSGGGPSSNGNSVSVFTSSGTPLSGSPFTGGSIQTPLAIAIDGSGDAWVAASSKYSGGYPGLGELAPSGAPITATPISSGIGLAFGVAVDPSGNIWAANSLAGVTGAPPITSIAELPAGGSATVAVSGGGINNPMGVAVDAAGAVWISNSTGNSVSELDSNGSPRSPATGFVSGKLQQPYKIAIDPSGNVWVTNYKYNSITELVGVAAPTRTPLVTHVTPGQGFVP